MNLRKPVALVPFLGWCLAVMPAIAQETETSFRVDTDIYEEGKKEPIKQTLTLFSQGVYYDFAIESSQDITIIDPKHGKIVLLSPQRQLKTTFKTDKLLAQVNLARHEMAVNEELARLLAAEKLVRFDANRGSLRVGDEALSYEATMQSAKDASMVTQYREFADWSARLNCVLPPKYPPFLRLELNKQIAERTMLPSRIDRVSRHNNRTIAYRSQLIVNGRLSKEDERNLDRVGQLLVSSKEVSDSEFMGARPPLIGKSGQPGASTR